MIEHVPLRQIRTPHGARVEGQPFVEACWRSEVTPLQTMTLRVFAPPERDAPRACGGKRLQAEVTKYKKALGIAIYLAMDRVDIMYAVKEFGRWRREPPEARMQAMKRLARYLAVRADCVVEIRRQSDQNSMLTTYAIWAGCKRTGRSCSYFVVSVGGVEVSLATRTLTSSGEAEFYIGVSGACEVRSNSSCGTPR